MNIIGIEYNYMVRKNLVKNYLGGPRIFNHTSEGPNELEALEKLYNLKIKLSSQVTFRTEVRHKRMNFSAMLASFMHDDGADKLCLYSWSLISKTLWRT